MEINPSSVVDILTLRYDPSIKPNLPIKTWKDFQPTIYSPNISQIEKSICNYIQQKLEKFQDEKVSIALSGGVDSTLVLSLLRKIKPEITIHEFLCMLKLGAELFGSVVDGSAGSKVSGWGVS